MRRHQCTLIYGSSYMCVFMWSGVGRGQESMGVGRESNQTCDKKVEREVLGTKGTEWRYRDREWREESTKPN